MNTHTANPISADAISLSYIQLAFHINQHIPGFVDAYFGPLEWKAQAEAQGAVPLAELRQRAARLLQDVESLPDERRREWINKQITAMLATLRRLEGESLPFDEELQLVYDIHPDWIDEAEFDHALRLIGDLLPGSQTLAERLADWDKQFEAPRDKILPLITCCRDEVQRRTRQLFRLPEEEEITLHMVENQTWSAYNWYLGNYRSRVEINTDLPVRINAMPFLMTHEGYPGHHTEHAVKEQHLYRRLGYAETCIALLNAPECVISEGIADMAWQIIFSEQALKTWLHDEFYPLAGISPDLASRDRVISHARRKLKAVSGNAAFMHYRDGEDEQSVLDYIRRYTAGSEQRIQQTYRFITDPLVRGYTFSYHYGRELLSQYVEAGDPAVRFQTLLEQMLTPSRVEAWLRA